LAFERFKVRIVPYSIDIKKLIINKSTLKIQGSNIAHRNSMWKHSFLHFTS